MTAGFFLVGDIGGTHARFAIGSTDVPGFDKILTLKCADYDSAEQGIKHYLAEVGAPSPSVICLAAAGPVVDRRVRFTNSHWSLAEADLAQQFRVSFARLLNDFEAVAYSIPLLRRTDCVSIGLPEIRALEIDPFTIGIIGPGTGLGVAGLAQRRRTLVPIVGEGGHVGFCPGTRLQIEILGVLLDRFGRVSAERLISGPGLENIYSALSEIHGEDLAAISAADIFARSAANSDVRAVEATSLFFQILGQVAGDLALTLGAADGIYIAGGIAKRYPDLLTSSSFRSAFENKGRHRPLMERIPTQLILHDQPGLLGAAHIARELARA